MRPRIGITTSTLDRAPEGPIRLSAATHIAYAHCVYQAGGLPLLLPNLAEAEDMEEILAPLDGLLLTGGDDVDPCYWNEPCHPAIRPVDPVRDRVEIGLVRAAVQHAVPMLGICRGMQVMAVATGGALWQDLPAQLPENVGHRQTRDRHLPSHGLTVAADSLLARIVDVGKEAGAKPLIIDVNSFHHQAVRTYGNLFSAIAWSADGVIEGIAAMNAYFALGVQWHPEEMADTDPVQARIFTAFVEAAREYSVTTP